MNMSWQQLITTPTTPPSQISGEWFVVRFMPDRVTGEVFNIGVVFIDDYRHCHYRLIDNANAFNCLFGANGVANVDFMLSVVDEMLSKNHYEIVPSPHIIYSPRRTARGSSVEAILDDLYNSMITLVCDQSKDKKDPAEQKTLTTPKLRSHVFKELKDRYPKLYEKIHNDKPISLRNPNNGRMIEVDMPITNYTGYERSTRQDYFATIISAAYLTPMQRVHQLSYVGATNVMNICELLGVGNIAKVALIVYLPQPYDYFTESHFLEAERDLDKCLYPLTQLEKDGYNVTIEIKETEQECMKTAVDFVHS